MKILRVNKFLVIYNIVNKRKGHQLLIHLIKIRKVTIVIFIIIFIMVTAFSFVKRGFSIKRLLKFFESYILCVNLQYGLCP